MKYFILSREMSPGVIVGRHEFTFIASTETFDSAVQFISDIQRGTSIAGDMYEFKVIKGQELDWEVETEKVTTTSVVEKSRKLKDIELT